MRRYNQGDPLPVTGDVGVVGIVSATDPQRTFLRLVGVEHLDIEFTNRIRRLRCDG